MLVRVEENKLREGSACGFDVARALYADANVVLLDDPLCNR